MAEENQIISMPCSPTARTVRVGVQQTRPVQLISNGESTNRIFLFGKMPANDGKGDAGQQRS